MVVNQKFEHSGLVIKAVSGVCYVLLDSGELMSCVLRGIFRKQEISPCAGDRVIVSFGKSPSESAIITDILPRKNQILRPPLANLDQLLFVTSTCEPAPNLLLLDQFIAVAEYQHITPVLVLTKLDLKSQDLIMNIYSRVGIPVISIDYSLENPFDTLKPLLCGNISAFTGNSGVGKSTLLNHLLPDMSKAQDTSEISRKLGRGRHTTRQVELFHLPDGGYIADTPGFSTMEMERYTTMDKTELADCFREFTPYLGRCQFCDCSHVCESGCGVLEAVQKTSIHAKRHENYCTIYKKLSEKKHWEARNKEKRR